MRQLFDQIDAMPDAQYMAYVVLLWFLSMVACETMELFGKWEAR